MTTRRSVVSPTSAPELVGTIAALFRYPVKSLAGEAVTHAMMGWHGLDGDRRLAIRRVGDSSGFPWLTASKVPELIRYTPVRDDGAPEDALPTAVRTPDGRMLPMYSRALADEIGQRYGAPVEMLHLRGGIFDDSPMSVITDRTVEAIAAMAGTPPDVRRFRPNVVIAPRVGEPFVEDTWLGGTLTFGDTPDGPTLALTIRDVRCVMVNLEPETAVQTPEVLKAIVRERERCAGLYATVTRPGALAVGMPVYMRPA